MLRIAFAGALALCAFVSTAADARRYRAPAPGCSDLDWMRGLCLTDRGRAVAGHALKRGARTLASLSGRASGQASLGAGGAAELLPHPAGCPGRAFCGCGAAVRVFGRPVRELWLAAAWFRFPRAAPGAGMVAVRRHHVFVLEAHLGGDTWLAYDANSGRRLTRLHPRSIAGYVIVNPYATRSVVGHASAFSDLARRPQAARALLAARA